MKTDSSVEKDWDDIIFENCNREYGSYVIRKSYSKNVLLGVLGSIAFVGLVCSLIFLLSIRKKEGLAIEVVKNKLEVMLQPPPSIKVTKNSAMSLVRIKVVNSNLPPKVTTTPTKKVEPTIATAKQTITESNEADTASVGNGLGEVAGDGYSSYTFVEEMPTYPGGITALYRYLQLKMRYPADAQRMRLEGTVHVSFTVDVNGMIRDVKVVKGLDTMLDKEAVYLVSTMPRWKPGRQDGKNVAVVMVLPIKFKL